MNKAVELFVHEAIPNDSLLYTSGRWLPTNPKLHATQCPVRNVYFHRNALFAHVPGLTDDENVNPYYREPNRLFFESLVGTFCGWDHTIL